MVRSSRNATVLMYQHTFRRSEGIVLADLIHIEHHYELGHVHGARDPFQHIPNGGHANEVAPDDDQDVPDGHGPWAICLLA